MAHAKTRGVPNKYMFGLKVIHQLLQAYQMMTVLMPIWDGGGVGLLSPTLHCPHLSLSLFLFQPHALYLSTAIRISLRLALTVFELIYSNLSSSGAESCTTALDVAVVWVWGGRDGVPVPGRNGTITTGTSMWPCPSLLS